MLTELRAMLAKATPGPWKSSGRMTVRGPHPKGGKRERIVLRAIHDNGTFVHDAHANTALIVAAVNALPQLLAVAEAANKLHDSHYTPELIRALAALDEGSPDAS